MAPPLTGPPAEESRTRFGVFMGLAAPSDPRPRLAACLLPLGKGVCGSSVGPGESLLRDRNREADRGLSTCWRIHQKHLSHWGVCGEQMRIQNKKETPAKNHMNRSSS